MAGLPINEELGFWAQRLTVIIAWSWQAIEEVNNTNFSVEIQIDKLKIQRGNMQFQRTEKVILLWEQHHNATYSLDSLD